MLSTVNAYMRLNIVGCLLDEDVFEIENGKKEVKVTTCDGRSFVFDAQDVEIIKNDFDGDFDGVAYIDKLITLFHPCSSEHHDKVDGVNIKGVPHRVYVDGELRVLYNEKKREVVLKCHCNELIRNIELLDSNYKLYKVKNKFL